MIKLAIRTIFCIGLFGLIGCVSMPRSTELPSGSEMTERLVQDWNSNQPDAIQYVKGSAGLIASSPQSLPAGVANIPFQISFNESAKLSSLHAFLRPIGISLVIPSPEIRDFPIVIFQFSGNLGDFLRALGVTYGVSFNWHEGGIITVEATSQYMLKVPQDAEMISEVQRSILALGAQDISGSLSAGSISYRATYDAHQRVLHYMKEVSMNSAVITLQAAIVTVSLDRDRDSGFDWSQLQAKVGALGIGDTTTSTEGGSVSSGGSDSAGGGSTVTPVESVAPVFNGTNLADAQSLLSLTSQAAGVIVKKGDLDLRAVIRLLSTYGETETTQSVLMKTLSGKPVRLDSSQQIPYVAQIGSTNNANQQAGGFSNQSNVQIEDLDVGLQFQLSPHFDAHTGLVTVGVDMQISSLISFIEVSAGNDIGNITRPNTQRQSFTDMLRMMPGESVIIGGLMYDQMSDSRSTLSIIDRLPLASRGTSSTRNALFILLRPTVVVFENGSEDSGLRTGL